MSEALRLVGTYASRDEADRARVHLQQQAIEEIHVEGPVAGVWQVKVRPEHAHTALQELERVEQWIAESH